MRTSKYSLDWYKANLPYGVNINEELTKTKGNAIYLDVDVETYPKLIDQMGIINFIELSMTQYTIDMYYSIGGDYVNADTFRDIHGYNNSFFKNNNDNESLFLDEAVTAEDDKYDFQEDTITMRSFKKMKR